MSTLSQQEQRWIEDYCNGTMSPDDFAQFESALDASAALRAAVRQMAGETFQALLFDIQGKQVMHEEIEASNTAETFSLSALSTGTYVLKIVQDSTNKSRTFKIVKN